MLKPLLLVACAALFAASAPLSAQKSSTKKSGKTTKAAPAKASNDKVVLATVGPEQVTYGDVERAFQKNMSRRTTPFSAVSRDSALEFMTLYTNYRLKVLDAKSRGLESDPAVQQELKNNRRLLAESFYFDKAIVDRRVDELTERRMTELQIGIILCAVPNMVTNAPDTARSYNKAENCIKALSNGYDFEKLAIDSSDDRETGQKGGLLPWITGGSIIKAVEDEAYRLKPGQHSLKPVESRFGYFIVKVYKREPRTMVKARHILLSPKAERDTVKTVAFAKELHGVLMMPKDKANEWLRAKGIMPSGDVFADLATTYSDDATTKVKGGSLGTWYTRSGGMENNGARVVPMFEEVMFRLKDGEISQPVTTLFGQHIVRRDSAKVPDAIVERDQTKRVYKRLYFEEDKRVLLDSIRPVYGFEWNQPVLNRFLSSIDTTKTSHDSTWSKTIPADMLHQTIYKAPFSGFTVMQFADTLRWRSDLRGLTMNRSGLDRAINKLTDAAVIDAATMKLEDSSEEFRALVKEFHDGILLFKVDEQEVWSKLKFDTADARVFYDSTRTRWKTDRKYVITEVYVLSDSIANEVHMRSDRGENLSDLAVQFTQREGAREKKGFVGAVTPKQNALARLAAEEGAKVGRIIGPIKNDKGWSIFRIDGIEEPREKTFEEAIPDLTSPYQDALQKRLTDQWLSKVRVRYPVVLDTKALDKVLASGKKK